MSEKEMKNYDFRYNPSSETRPYKCVVNAFEAGGFQKTSSVKEYNGFWGMDQQIEVQKMHRYQKINHFPGCWNLGRKGKLLKKFEGE
jgi:tubulin polyglutamylase TTLL4